MDNNFVTDRIKVIEKAIETCVFTYHQLVGSKNELLNLLNNMSKIEPEIAEDKS